MYSRIRPRKKKSKQFLVDLYNKRLYLNKGRKEKGWIKRKERIPEVFIEFPHLPFSRSAVMVLLLFFVYTSSVPWSHPA